MSIEKSIEGFGDQPCLFLDRDGVICDDVPYNTHLELVSLRPGIVDLCRRAHEKGFWITVVSNQSGLGRGYFSWSDYRQVHQRICQLLADEGQWVDLALCAPFYTGTEFKEAKARPHFRKPDIGMFEHARQELGIQYLSSTMIGDSATDLFPGFECGIPNLYLVESEKQAGEIEKIKEYQKTHPEFNYKFIKDYKDVQI
jgi:histidinol-phosphate phosphatase family protein